MPAATRRSCAASPSTPGASATEPFRLQEGILIVIGTIVVGNKGISSLRRFILGNAPNKVVHNSPCSTYVVNTES
jgi:nucleotide-binding universal stress UspA family protein